MRNNINNKMICKRIEEQYFTDFKDRKKVCQ